MSNEVSESNIITTKESLTTSNDFVCDVSSLKPTEDDVAFYNRVVKPRLYNLTLMVRDKTPENEIFAFLGIDKARFLLFKRWFPEFKNAITVGKLQYVDAAETALKNLATGVHYVERDVVETYVPDSKGNFRVVSKKVRTTEKFRPPDVKAIELILTNKNPGEWQKSGASTSLLQNNNVVNIDVSESAFQKMIERLGGTFVDTKDVNSSKAVSSSKEVPIDVEEIE